MRALCNKQNFFCVSVILSIAASWTFIKRLVAIKSLGYNRIIIIYIIILLHHFRIESFNLLSFFRSEW